MDGLVSIPVVDVREGGPVRHAIEGRARVVALRGDLVSWFPKATHWLFPVLDGLTRRWLKRSGSPYLAEIESIAATFDFPGIWFLNGCYEWGCTTLAREEGGVPWLARTLDWPFPGLGRYTEVARMAGAAGDFWSATWPGYVGVLTAMAPGRFAAALNQAPLWRRTRTPWLRLYDMAMNAVSTWSLRHIPPDQLLRECFESCRTFGEARKRLETVPVARPVIFTLVGCSEGERCVIERTETTFVSRDEETGAANDWLRPKEPWEGRIHADVLFTCEYEEAAENSAARRAALADWRGCFASDSFGWVAPPVLNRYTRLAAEMCPANGALRLVGYEQTAGDGPSVPATKVFDLVRERIAA